ncbi:MAG: hypothetical protein R3F56_07975 [Planctomycetota bacterium]
MNTLFRNPGRPSRAALSLPLGLPLGLLLAACGGSRGRSSTVPDLSLASFTRPTVVDNSHFPLRPGLAHTFVSRTGDVIETEVLEITSDTRVVAGILCVVVHDQVFENGLLIEDTRDWYAQDDAGNVWYMGEDVDNHQYDDEGNLTGTDHEGAWEAGKDIAGIGTPARPGFIMPAAPRPGARYHEEFYPGVAEDLGEVVALDVPVELGDGRQLRCLQVLDSSTLAPSTGVHKFFAPGLGLVLERDPNTLEENALVGSFRPGSDSVPAFAAATFSNPTQVDARHAPFPADTVAVHVGRSDDGNETIVVERTGESKSVMGIACLEVRDRVFREGLLHEDTRDWYAQDDAGNVWYMGEAVDNYHYDDEGNLLEIDHEGSWEAGRDVAGLGSTAAPGHLLPAVPTVGEGYHQEFYDGAAEDMAIVVATGVELELDHGVAHSDCLQTLEWSPLAPDALEYKFYAPGVGVVQEQALHADETVDHVAGFYRGPGAIPDFAAARFSDPTRVDHPLLPLPPGATWSYEKETDTGVETTTVEVLSTTREVLGVVCLVVRDRVEVEGRLHEDTRDWYAQDDAGNVWYMGEDVDNYHYDEQGNLLEITHEGSWEAGRDVASVGHVAQPGYQMPAAPRAGQSYHQEFYRSAAEDMAAVVAVDVTLQVGEGAALTGCVQTAEWNPLAPHGVELKFYAPGLGLVLVRDLVEGETLELVESSLR